MRQACQHLYGTHCEVVLLHTVLSYQGRNENKKGKKKKERKNGGKNEEHKGYERHYLTF
jgi:uncharacterized protein YvpB